MTRLRVYPLLFMFLLLALILAVALLFPGGRLRSALLSGSGMVLLVVGAALIAVAAGLFRQHRTTLNPHGESSMLVQNGLYRYSRNPMYLGMLLVLVGVALALGQPAAWLVPPVFVAVVTRANVRHEEQLLEERFGDDYRTYRQRVRRWI